MVGDVVLAPFPFTDLSQVKDTTRCQQIAQGTDKGAKHLVEMLAEGL